MKNKLKVFIHNLLIIKKKTTLYNSTKTDVTSSGRTSPIQIKLLQTPLHLSPAFPLSLSPWLLSSSLCLVKFLWHSLAFFLLPWGGTISEVCVIDRRECWRQPKLSDAPLALSPSWVEETRNNKPLKVLLETQKGLACNLVHLAVTVTPLGQVTKTYYVRETLKPADVFHSIWMDFANTPCSHEWITLRDKGQVLINVRVPYVISFPEVFLCIGINGNPPLPHTFFPFYAKQCLVLIP